MNCQARSSVREAFAEGYHRHGQTRAGCQECCTCRANKRATVNLVADSLSQPPACLACANMTQPAPPSPSSTAQGTNAGGNTNEDTIAESSDAPQVIQNLALGLSMGRVVEFNRDVGSG